jgi:hypothetical protein
MLIAEVTLLSAKGLKTAMSQKFRLMPSIKNCPYNCHEIVQQIVKEK